MTTSNLCSYSSRNAFEFYFSIVRIRWQGLFFGAIFLIVTYVRECAFPLFDHRVACNPFNTWLVRTGFGRDTRFFALSFNVFSIFVITTVCEPIYSACLFRDRSSTHSVVLISLRFLRIFFGRNTTFCVEFCDVCTQVFYARLVISW